jgi:glycolate oxidase FAD binding subunit
MAHGTRREVDREMTAVAVDSVDELRNLVLDAAKRGVPLRVAGRGTWLDSGRPVRSTETVSTRELSGITEYVPGDLTLTARAGTTLGEIRDATRKHGQWLALDPAGSDDGTLGATIATASSGPAPVLCLARRAILRWVSSSSPALESSRAAAGAW